MQAWVEGMAGSLGRRFAVTRAGGQTLVAGGVGEGDTVKIPLEVNGVTAGWVEITPGSPDEVWMNLVRQAVGTLQALAEVKNSMADLVRTTAHQWRELSLLYRFSDLVAGGQDPEALASLLVGQAQRALRSRGGAIRYRLGEDVCGFSSVGDQTDGLEDLTEWGAELETGAIIAAGEELSPYGFPGDPPTQPVLVVPLRCHDQSYGALAVTSGTGEVFNAEDLKLASLLARQAGLAFANLELIDQVREHERIRRELEVAAEIQASILPPAYTETATLEIAGTCLPAQWVGGDTFFVLPQEGGLLAGVADVSGHGISSALLMNAFASEIEALSMTLTHPAELLRITNRLLTARVGTMGLFVTVVLLRYWSDGSVTIANAGHPPPMVITSDGSVNTVEASNLPLGILEEETYDETRLEAGQQESIVVYSDGITEAVTPDGTMYGIDRGPGHRLELDHGVRGPRVELAEVLGQMAVHVSFQRQNRQNLLAGEKAELVQLGDVGGVWKRHSELVFHQEERDDLELEGLLLGNEIENEGVTVGGVEADDRHIDELCQHLAQCVGGQSAHAHQDLAQAPAAALLEHQGLSPLLGGDQLAAEERLTDAAFRRVPFRHGVRSFHCSPSAPIL